MLLVLRLMDGLKKYKFINMRVLTFLFLVFFTQLVLGQYEFNINESEYDFTKGSHHGFSIPIYESSVHDIEKDWKKLMREWHGKVDEKKHEFFADNASLKSMGENSFDTYAYCKERENSIDFIVAVDLGGAFLNMNQHKEQSKVFKTELLRFAKQASSNGLDSKIKKAIHTEHNIQKELDHLDKEQQKLNHDIEVWQKSIKKAENDIEENNKNQDLKKDEVKKQKELVNKLKLQKQKIK